MLVLNVLYLAIALLQTAAQENCPKLENVTNTRCGISSVDSQRN